MRLGSTHGAAAGDPQCASSATYLAKITCGNTEALFNSNTTDRLRVRKRALA